MPSDTIAQEYNELADMACELLATPSVRANILETVATWRKFALGDGTFADMILYQLARFIKETKL